MAWYKTVSLIFIFLLAQLSIDWWCCWLFSRHPPGAINSTHSKLEHNLWIFIHCLNVWHRIFATKKLIDQHCPKIVYTDSCPYQQFDIERVHVWRTNCVSQTYCVSLFVLTQCYRVDFCQSFDSGNDSIVYEYEYKDCHLSCDFSFMLQKSKQPWFKMDFFEELIYENVKR